MTTALIKNPMISTNTQITFASMVISIFPLFFICPLAETCFNSITSVILTMLVPVVIYGLMLTRFNKAGLISPKANYPLFVLNFLASIILLSGSSTVVYVISAFRIH